MVWGWGRGKQNVLGDEILREEFVGSSLEIISTFATPNKLKQCTSPSLQRAPKCEIKHPTAPHHYLDYLLPESCGRGFHNVTLLMRKKTSEAQKWAKTLLTSGIVYWAITLHLKSPISYDENKVSQVANPRKTSTVCVTKEDASLGIT